MVFRQSDVMYNYNMTLKLILPLIMTMALSCERPTKTNYIKRIELVYSARKIDQINKLSRGKPIAGDFLNLMISKVFYTDQTDTSAYSRTISVTIPDQDTAFSLSNSDSIRNFILLKQDCRGLCADINMKEIKEGRILGKRLDNLTWKVIIEHKEFSLDTTLKFKMNQLQKATIKK